MAHHAHPPTPGPIVQPNFLAIMEAIDVPFPISKRELIEEVEDDTVLLGGRNVSLHDVIKDIHDDYFESESEFLDALENHYSTLGDHEAQAETEAARLPNDGPMELRGGRDLGDEGATALDVRPELE